MADLFTKILLFSLYTWLSFYSIRKGRTLLTYKFKQILSIVLIAALLITGLPLYPGAGSWLTPTAEASTNMRIEPSEINISKGEKTSILFSFNAADSGQEEHETIIMACTPQPNGSAPVPGGIIKQGSFKTREGNQYIVHEVEWDGKIDGRALPEGRYTICVAPASYNGSGVYYGQMASFEIVESERPAVPTAIAAAPAAAGKIALSGIAEAGTAVEVEGSATGSDVVQPYGTATVNTGGKWSLEAALPANKIVNLTARATASGVESSGYSEMISVMSYSLPSYPVSWEAAAAFFYKTDKASSTAQQAQEILAWNNASGSTASPINGLSSLLLIDPQTEVLPTAADLPLFNSSAIAKRLMVVNPTGLGPVDPTRGDFVYSSPSLFLQALMPLDFGLLYLSRNPEIGTIGQGWTHAYDWSLQPIDGKMELLQPDGSRFEFIPLASGGFLSPKGTEFSLERDGADGHTLTSLLGEQYRFDSAGMLQSITDLNGNAIQLTYSGTNLLSVSTPGASLQLQYNGNGKLASVSDHSGRTIGYGYNAAGDLITITDVDGGVTDLTYDGNHHVVSVTNPGKTGTMSVVYDDKQRVVSLTDYYGEKQETTYSGKAAPVVRGEYEEGGPISILPENARDIEDSEEVLLSGTMHNVTNAPAYRHIDGLQPVISAYLNKQSGTVRQVMESLEASAADYSSSSVEQLEAASMQGNTSQPAIIKGGGLSVENSVTFGSPTKPVILIVDGMNTNKEITVEVYGTLILKNGMNANTKLNLRVHSVAGSYGNIWSGGRIHLNNDSTVHVQDSLYTEGLTYNSGLLSVSARRITVNGELHINTKVQMDISNEMTLGGLVSNNELAELTIVNGDLFVRENVHVNNSLDIKTGGVFAIGGDMVPNRKPVLKAGVGNGQTLLKYPENSNAPVTGQFVAIKAAVSLVPSGSTVQKDALGRKTILEWNDRFQLKSKVQPDGAKLSYHYDKGDRLRELKDGNGQLRKSVYDARGNLLQAVSGSGQSDVYRYNEMNRLAAAADSFGNVDRYSYDTAGHLTAYENALGERSTIERDSKGVPIRKVNAAGVVTSFVNDTHGFVVSVRDAAGYEMTLERDALHRVVARRDGVTEETLQYDNKDRIISTRNALGETTSSAYDLNGNHISATDAAGGQELYGYDINRLTSVTNVLGDQVSYQYDHVGNLTRWVDENGAATEFVYDEMNRVSRKIDADGNEATYVYDANGNTLELMDAVGNVTRYTYNNDNQLLTTTDPLGAVTRNKYDSQGQLVKSTNALGNSTWYHYDAAGRMVKTIDALGGETQYVYDDGGRLASTIDVNGSVWQNKYDDRGLSAGSIDPLLGETTIQRDLSGRVAAFVDAEGSSTRYEYDDLGRHTEIVNALGHATSYEYDLLGNVSKIRDANGEETSFQYNALGQLLAVTNALGETTRYTYDKTGQLLEQTNALGHTTSYTYNALGQVEQRINPLGEIRSYAYDGNGLLLSQNEPDGISASYTYDAAGRVVAIAYSDGKEVRYTYDLIGRRIEMKDETGLTRYTSDALNRPTEIIDARGNNMRYEWDRSGNRSRVIYPDNSFVNYNYDELGRLTQVQDASMQITNYTYDKNNRITSKQLPGGSRSLYVYDGLGQLLELNHLSPGSETLERLRYSYDAVGNMISYNRQKRGADEDNPTGAVLPEESVLYEYDALNQLVEARKLDGTSDYTSYAYDTFGNRISKTSMVNGAFTSESYTYDAANKMMKLETGSEIRSYSYDARGNLLQVQSDDAGVVRTLEQYSWTAAGRLATHINESGDLTSYQYDGDGNRVFMGITLGSREAGDSYPAGHPLGSVTGWEPQNKKEQQAIYFANDTTIPYVEPVMATSADGNWKQRYVYGALNERISMSYQPSGDPGNEWEAVPGVSGADRSSAYETLYYLADIRGSAIGLIDDNSQVAARYSYDEFGNPLDAEKFDMNWSGPDNLFGYTGLGYDYSSGLSYARARYLDASVGRFVSEDTYEGQQSNPLSLNLFTYVENNPLKYTDPTGFKACEGAYTCEGKNEHPVANPSNWIKIGDGIYKIVDGYTMGALSDYVNVAETKPYSVEQLLSAAWLVVSVVPISKSSVTTKTLGNNFIQKSGNWFKVTFSKTATKCNCFTAGTMVLTDEGEKNIEDIEVGDMVLSKNEETGEQAYKEVTHLYQNDKEIIYELTVGDQVIETTDNHPFWVEGKGWVLAADLQDGDKLQQSNGNTLTIENIEIVKQDKPVKVYNFTVADFHTYFVSDLGIWVHNINCDFTLSSNNIQHIGKHIASDFAYQVPHLSDKALAAKLNKNSFFNPKWTKEDIITGVQNGANEAISKGFTNGYYKYSHKGETIQIFFKDGKFDTAFGQHKLTLADFGR
jgi:RHS repeat-associated protein